MVKCRQLTYTQAPLATGLAALAWIRQANGDPAGGALEAIEEAGLAAQSEAVTSLLNPVPAQRALLLAQGEVAAAGRWVEERGLDPDDDPGYPAGARVSGAGPGAAARRTASVRHSPCWSGCTRRPPPRAALAASSRSWRSGRWRGRLCDENAAVNTLARALILACPQGYVRVFADEGPPMAALLARLVAAQNSDHAAARDVPLGLPGPGCLGLSAKRPPRRAPGNTPRWRCRAWWSS